MNEPLVSLDDLFKEAKKQLRVMKAAKAEAPPPDPQRLYTDPDNWTRARGVALIHTETETLLGNFTEYLHKSVAGCRRLVREEGPLAVSAVERVSGSWWISSSLPELEPPQEWHTRQAAIIAVQLPRLGVHLPICEVVACLSYGAIARVELAADSMFAQVSGDEQLLFLPAGTDVLGEMGMDCKVALRVELKLEAQA